MPRGQTKRRDSSEPEDLAAGRFKIGELIERREREQGRLLGSASADPPQVFGRKSEKTAMKEKTCTRCGEAKEPAEFPLNKRTRDGLGSWCRACVNEARRVVPRYAYLDGATVPNPDPRPKSKVR